MRVVGGSLRGKTLGKNISKKIKPTNNKVKEAIFNIIGDKIKDSVFIDLFSGTGNVGIEALSRGARRVHFNDINKNAIKSIYNNIYNLNLDKFKISNLDYKKFLKNEQIKGDIIFVDAPFFDIDIKEVVDNILNSKILKKDSIILLETDKNTNFTLNNNSKLKEYKYGRIKLFKITLIN